MAKKEINVKDEHIAKASSLNLAISTKHSIEICNFLRYKPLSFAKAYLEDVAEMKKAIPFNRFNKDMGHKKGMSAGRYPVKAAKLFLVLLNSAEANAQFKGLNTSGLKITKILSNRASIPSTGGRSRTGTKRTSLEIEVKEVLTKKEDKKTKKDVKLETPQTEAKVEKQSEESFKKPQTEDKKAEELKAEEKKEAVVENKEELTEIKDKTESKESKELKENMTEKKEAVGENKE